MTLSIVLINVTNLLLSYCIFNLLTRVRGLDARLTSLEMKVRRLE
jgi:hypothetical protein